MKSRFVTVYPKIPRHNHPVVPADNNETEDLTLIEKYDGTSFRFTMFEERFETAYTDQVIEQATGDGSLVFGTRKQIRGAAADSLAEIDGALHRAVRCLRDGVDTSALDVFELVNGPVVTSGDVASVTGCSQDSARRKLNRLHEEGRVGRRKTAGRIVYWQLDAVEPAPVNPNDPIFVDRPSFASGKENLSERVDELLYGDQ